MIVSLKTLQKNTQRFGLEKTKTINKYTLKIHFYDKTFIDKFIRSIVMSQIADMI